MKQDKPFLWVTHCPRTGGTSVKLYCEKLKTRGLVECQKTAHRRYKTENHEQLKAKYKRVVPITVLRDPVMNELSVFSYVRTDRGHPNYGKASKGLAGWLGSIKIPYYVGFYGWGDIDAAEENLRKFDYILQTETLKRDFNKALSELGLPTGFNIHAHKGDTRRYHPTPQEVKAIKAVRKLDYELLSRLNIHYED